MDTARRYDILTMGRSCIDLYAHEIGVPITGVRSFDTYVGGCPTNISVGTRRLGLRSALLTAVGEDQIADFVLTFLEREGVDTRFIAKKPGHRTSAVVLTIMPPDRFPLTYYRDNCADRELTIDDVRRAPVADSAMLLVTGTGLSHEPGRSATFFAARTGREAGTRVLVDLDYRPDQWPDRTTFSEQMRSLLARAHLVVGTEEEVRAAADTDDLHAAVAVVLTTGVEALVLKRGKDGSTVLRIGAAPIDVAPFPIEVLNVLGAGDAFASGLIYGLRQDWPLERAARMANAVGAIVVTRRACANDMPTRAEVEAFVSERGGW
jgi:5-dehydro-2-deoxygluconokinase